MTAPSSIDPARVLHEHGYVLGHFGKNHCFTPEDFDACFDRVFEAGHGDAIGPGITSVRSVPPVRPMVPDPGGLRRPVARVRDEPPQESATYQVTEQAIRALAAREEPMVAILWGRNARNLKPILDPIPCIESAHPSPLSAHAGFFGSKPFSRANELLADQGAKPIDWKLP